MDSTQRRMIAVAVAVCAFAVGMAGLLNFFKYRATARGLIEQRLSFSGRSIENSIQSSLSLGLQFGDIATLPAMLARERAGDDLILGIDIFNADGTPIYSTDPSRAAQPVPAVWHSAARKAGDQDWVSHGEDESVVGVGLQNNLGLTIGHIALRYSEERVRQAGQAVARDLALNSLLVFVVSAMLSSLALLAVMRRLARDMQTVEQVLRTDDPLRAEAAARRSPFRDALIRFGQTVRSAENELADARAQLRRGAGA